MFIRIRNLLLEKRLILCKMIVLSFSLLLFAFLHHYHINPRILRKFSFNESRSFITSGSSWKSNNWLFSRIRSSCMDFGMTTRSCCKLQHIRTCTGVLPYFFVSPTLFGSLSLFALVNEL